MAAHQAPPSLGFSRQEHWSGLPLPSPMHESEKWKWSHSVVSDSSDPMDCSLPGSSFHGIFQARVLEWGAIAFSAVHTYKTQKEPLHSTIFFIMRLMKLTLWPTNRSYLTVWKYCPHNRFNLVTTPSESCQQSPSLTEVSTSCLTWHSKALIGWPWFVSLSIYVIFTSLSFSDLI